jgi:RimJ/RimL family protein N-acetyltransferase
MQLKSLADQFPKTFLLQDQQLLLRSCSQEDADLLVKAVHSSSLGNLSTIPDPYSQTDAETFLKQQTEKLEADQNLVLFVFDLQETEMLGQISLKRVDQENFWIGYWIVDCWRRQNLAQKIVKILTEKITSQMLESTIKIYAQIRSANQGSMKVLEKSGFKLIDPEGQNNQQLKFVWSYIPKDST